MEKNATRALVTLGIVALGVYAVRRAFAGSGEGGPPDAPPGDNVTLSREVLRYLAREVYVAAWGVHGWDLVEDEARISAAILQCRTDDDLLALSQAYGCRAPSFSLGCLSLSETVRRFFSRDELQALNEGLRSNGLTIGL